MKKPLNDFGTTGRAVNRPFSPAVSAPETKQVPTEAYVSPLTTARVHRNWPLDLNKSGAVTGAVVVRTPTDGPPLPADSTPELHQRMEPTPQSRLTARVARAEPRPHHVERKPDMQRDFSQGSRKLGYIHHCATLWNPHKRQLIQAYNVVFEEPTDVSTDSTDFSTNSTVVSTNPTDDPTGLAAPGLEL
jgi:hypothetical protein